MQDESLGESALPCSEKRISVLVELEIAKIPRQDIHFAIEFLQSLRTPGFEVDAEYGPVVLTRKHGLFRGQAVGSTVVMQGTFGDEDDIDKLRQRPEILEVWLDPPLIEFERAFEAKHIAKFRLPYVCHEDLKCSDYDIDEVITYLGVDKIWNAGFRGEGIVVGVVDSGIDKRRVPNAKVTNGWPANAWGVASDEHGAMIATDIIRIAPNVELFDLNISDKKFDVRLRNAIKAYEWAICLHTDKGVPHILTNSWGLPCSADAPDYANWSDHPFTIMVVKAIDEGLAVLFAAGNCGYPCADNYMCCGETGPGGTIWGANGHERVMTVGAANISGQYFGDSSHGPAALAQDKPDFCSPSYFCGGYYAVDPQTSAATAVLAGLVALIKQAHPKASHLDIKNALIKTAEDIHLPGFDPQSGHGVVQGYSAYRALRFAIWRMVIRVVFFPFWQVWLWLANRGQK